MKLDLTDLLKQRSDAVRFDYTFDPSHTDAECVEFPDDVTIPENGIHVTGEAVDSFGCLWFRAHVTVSYMTRCARCLDDIRREVSFDVERMILTEAAPEVSHLDDDGEWDGVTDDVLVVNEGKLIPDADLIEEASLAIPTFDLCEPDCPGLCPKCGKRLKDGDCGCREDKYVNPKFAILQTLLDKDPKEEN